MTVQPQLWAWLYRLFWRAAWGLGLGASAIELILGGPASRIAGVTYLLGTALIYPWQRGYPKAAIGAHLFMATLTTLWLFNQPALSIASGWTMELSYYTSSALATLVVTALGALLGGWGALMGLVLMVALLPHPTASAWLLASPLWALGGLVGIGVNWGLGRLEKVYATLEQAALTDFLTNLGNRRSLEADFGRYQALAEREGQPLLFSLWDLDGLKAVNDQQGHAAGDEYLRGFAEVLKHSVRKGDALYRIGGDEFCGLHLSLSDGKELASRVRSSFAQVSVGWIDAQHLSLDQALSRADTLLYQDKTRRVRKEPLTHP
ncbi:MAG: GGDEF domain-containing protein [Thermaceae bacterium]|nr:GGDEF domain-containing protein [Thermaceae bacterium]